MSKTIRKMNDIKGIEELCLVYTSSELSGRVIEMTSHMAYLKAIADTMPEPTQMKRIIELMRFNSDLFAQLVMHDKYSFRVEK